MAASSRTVLREGLRLRMMVVLFGFSARNDGSRCGVREGEYRLLAVERAAAEKRSRKPISRSARPFHAKSSYGSVLEDARTRNDRRNASLGGEHVYRQSESPKYHGPQAACCENLAKGWPHPHCARGESDTAHDTIECSWRTGDRSTHRRDRARIPRASRGRREGAGGW